MPRRQTRPWWRGRWFVRLLSVRVAGQSGDGVFQAALASYALFSDDQATAGEIAVAAAVILLPYSLLGPYAGVLLDRWSRRQVLLLGNALRAVVLVLLAAAVLGDAPEAAVYAGALVALGTNRFLLAGLSAALPHTVPQASLTEANAVTPTLGTASFVAGLGLAVGLRGWAGAGAPSVLLLAGGTYLLAGALALRLPRPLLGPDEPPHLRPRPSVRHLAAGFAEGFHHLRSRPQPASALAALTSMRLWFGLVTVSAVLSLRNATGEEAQAVAALGGFTAATAAGFLSAAVVTPLVARRTGRPRALRLALLVAGLSPIAAAVSPTSGAWWLTGAVLGLGAQASKICVDAIVQAGVDDDVRGRVFALYDVAFNVAFVAAAVLAVLVLPADGRSVPVLLTCAAGLLLTAAGLAGATRPRSAP